MGFLNKSVVCVTVAALLSGCGTSFLLPKSEGEKSSGFSYVPLDPLPVSTVTGASCGTNPGVEVPEKGYTFPSLLLSLPDNAVRIAVKTYDRKNVLSYVGSSVGVEGNRYQVILDYINLDVANIPFYIKTVPEGDKLLLVSVNRINRADARAFSPLETQDEKERRDGNVVIPVYVGVGLRLTANLQVLKGKLNLSSLGSIAAGVESGQASGSLVVQTLGVTGKQVSTSLPLPSELNQTTVQNAILSLGSIKAVMFDEANTKTTPRVLGIYLPLKDGNEDLVNAIVSELAKAPIPWQRACIPVAEKKPT